MVTLLVSIALHANCVAGYMAVLHKPDFSSVMPAASLTVYVCRDSRCAIYP